MARRSDTERARLLATLHAGEAGRKIGFPTLSPMVLAAGTGQPHDTISSQLLDLDRPAASALIRWRHRQAENLAGPSASL